MNRSLLALACALTVFGFIPAHSAPQTATLDNLRKLPIVCLAPKWLPEGYHLRTASIDRDDREGLENAKAPGFAAYDLEYTNGKNGRFTVESARWGIGDRNLDEDENAEESAFDTKDLGKVYIIYFPKGKSGVKKRIVANWIADARWRAEERKNKTAIHLAGRVHGVSGFGMTLAEFEKIVQSLQPLGNK